ncbi:MAG: hypothetical protein K2Q12_04270 [Rickettsiales bacterium]|nr:hypothetical protein [Rickettsiales bacterium]
MTLALQAAQTALWSDFGLRAVVAAELEWYVWPRLTDNQHPSAPLPVDLPLDMVEEWIRVASSAIGVMPESIERERGTGQWECSLPMQRDAMTLANQLTQLRVALQETFSAHGYVACFDAKPFANTYGSAMHIHIHLEDAAGENVYWKDSEQLSGPLSHSLGGLLATTRASLDVFAPTAAARTRFVAGWHAPVNASWGGNNRTVALRLPDGTGKLSGHANLLRAIPSRERRIEHRVAGADADPFCVIEAILNGIHYGLRHRVAPPAAIHGDAADSRYHLPHF